MNFAKWLSSIFLGREPAQLRFPHSNYDDLLPEEDQGLPRSFGDGSERFDSVYNTMTSIGSGADKGASADVDYTRAPLPLVKVLALYRFNGMARRIVDLLPLRATRKGWSVNSLHESIDELHPWDRVREAMQWARAGGNALVMPIMPELGYREGDREFLATPIQFNRVGYPEAIHVFDASEISVNRWCRDITSPLFRQPELWDISCDGWSATVHASRVALFRGSRNPPSYARHGSVPDDSILQSIWDEIARLTQTMQGGATLAQELRESVFKIANLDSVATGSEASWIGTKLKLVNQARSLIGLIMIDKDDEYENRSNPPTGFEELSAAAKSMLAAVSGYPEITLYGNSPGGLSSDGESGHASHRQQIADYQEENRESILALYRLANRGRPIDDLKFHPLDEPSGKEAAETAKTNAESDKIYIETGVLTPKDVAKARFSDEEGELEVEDLESVPDEHATAEQTNGAGSVEGEGGDPEGAQVA